MLHILREFYDDWSSSSNSVQLGSINKAYEFSLVALRTKTRSIIYSVYSSFKIFYDYKPLNNNYPPLQTLRYFYEYKILFKDHENLIFYFSFSGSLQ